MKIQLIVTILGTDRVGILGRLAATLSKVECNILDSRQAIYGQDFSLTMIVEGSMASITRAELQIPKVCNELDLLCMMKRTKQHCKQNLSRLADVEVSGVDAVGMMSKLTNFFGQHHIDITAFRQQTYQSDNGDDMMTCKMVVNIGEDIDEEPLRLEFNEFSQSLGLQGSLTEKH